ncbi:hypothetical protein [Gulosibacter faecalis]|uniref:Uncharacterized protein n=1 Tax=Gulosibacter faecalis TaxID=272240 RepID=A0ABW5UYS8_9MICO|nr:hypothetical protein [Gulosibacter faecalis]
MLRKPQLSQVFLWLSGLGAVTAVAGIVLLFTPLHTLGIFVLPLGIVMCVGFLIATAVADEGEEKRAFAKGFVTDARIVNVIGTGGTGSADNRLERLRFDVHVEIDQGSGAPLKRIVGVVGDAGFAHTLLNPGQYLRIRHNTMDPDDRFDARYDAPGQMVADLKRIDEGG